MLKIDEYAYNNRIVAWSPYLKSLLYVTLLLVSLMSNVYIQCAVFIVMVAVTIYVAHLGIWQYVKWLAIPFLFLLFSIVPILFSISSNGEGAIFQVHIANMYFTITEETIFMTNSVLFRTLACVSCTYFFILTVPFQQLVKVLKAIKLPHIIIEFTVLIYRFIFIFIEEAAAIRKAQSLRFGYSSVRNGYMSLSLLVNVLFTNIMKRYNAMVVTLDVKLYDDEFYV